jgi:hypothetical protein
VSATLSRRSCAVFALATLGSLAPRPGLAAPPVAIEKLSAEVAKPVASTNAERRYLGVRLTVRGVRHVPRESDLAVAASCRVGDRALRDRARLQAIHLDTLRPRELRHYGLALFVHALLPKEPRYCELSAYFVAGSGKPWELISRHCLRKGKTHRGKCVTDKDKPKRPRLVAERRSK